MIPVQKLGIALPSTDMPEMNKSKNVLRLIAEIIPNGIAMIVATTIAATASSKLAGSLSSTSGNAD
ncbi:hypothetical protein D3C73_1510340 [compost metagenome]